MAKRIRLACLREQPVNSRAQVSSLFFSSAAICRGTGCLLAKRWTLRVAHTALVLDIYSRVE